MAEGRGKAGPDLPPGAGAGGLSGAEEALRAALEKETFLVALGDALRLMSDPADMVAATTRALGERLGAARVVYSDIDAEEIATTEGGWTDGATEHLPRRLRAADFGSKLIDRLRSGETLVIRDVRGHPATTDVLPALEAIGVAALVSVPLVLDGRFAANINVHSRAPRDWTAQEVELIEAVAVRTWDVLARARAVRKMAERERELQTLTDALPVLISYIDADRRYRFINRVYEDWFPRRRDDILGEPVAEVLGEAAYARVSGYVDRVLAGERLKFEQLMPYPERPARHVEGEYIPRTNAEGRILGFYALVQDVTERVKADAALRASEARLSFLDRLGAATAHLADADAVLARTTRMLGEHLGLAICAYADMDEDQDGFTIRGDWTAPGSASIVGRYRLADFGALAVRNLSAGEPLIVNDNLRQLPPEEAATFQNIGIAATICMPLVKEGRLVALMAIHDRVPRTWMEAELNLLREVTSRSWAHVERVGAVADLRASEAALRDLNADLERQVVERSQARGRTWLVSPDLMGALNAEGRFETSNPAWRTVLGWSEAEVAGMSIWELVHPDDLDRTRAAFALTQDGRPMIQFPNRYRRKGGGHRWISWVGVPEGGMVYCTGRDITAEKEKEAELAARTQERDRLWRNSQDIAIVIDLAGTFKAVNPAATRILGWAPEEMVGRSVFEFIHPDDVAPSLGALEHARGRELPIFENRYRHKDGGHRWLSWVAAPEGELIYATARHVTAEKEAAAELALAQEALRQSQKLEAMGQLTGGVAHDFNNLLTPIIGSLDMLIRRGVGSERERRLIDGALQSAERAKTLVQRLLAFARRQPLQTSAVDLGRLVGGMAGLVGSTLGPRIDVRVEMAGDLPPARADANQLEMALLNLAVNARDAMAEGGVLTISGACETLAAGDRPGLKPGRYVRLSVSDTGHGMDQETLERAIEPFFSTKGLGKGTGLGLSMVHGLAAQLGGGLGIASAPGEGATIDLWLPVSDDPVGNGGVGGVAPPPTAARGRALLVDDEELVRLSTADMLVDLGFDVVEAGSAEEALRLLRLDPSVDLLITDHLMPGTNGADLARAARALKPGLPVLIVSGYAEVDGVAPDLPRLTKPFRNAELAERLAALLPAR